MLKIDFYKLIKDYDLNLLDNLRGFGKDKDYLKFWVPGTNNYKSLINLIDALYESKKSEILISIKNHVFHSDEFNKFDTYLKKICDFKKEIHGTNYNYYIFLNREDYQKFRFKNKIRKIQIHKDTNRPTNIKPFVSKKNIEDLYLKNISKINYNNYYVSKIIKKQNIFDIQIENFTLAFRIEDKLVQKAYHNCNTFPLNSLINILFDICVNKNIQELADHSIIYLEEKIRLQDTKIVKKGVILPHHAGNYFDKLNKAIRQVYNNYKKSKNYKFGINKHYFKKSYYWINLSEEQKLKKIEYLIEDIRTLYGLKRENIFAQSIEDNFKVLFFIDSEFTKLQNKKNILLEIEIKLKNIDETLEVFVDEALDKNKLRIKNSPQTKLLK